MAQSGLAPVATFELQYKECKIINSVGLHT